VAALAANLGRQSVGVDYSRDDKEGTFGPRRICEDFLDGQTRLNHIVAKHIGHFQDVEGGRNTFGVQLLQFFEVSEQHVEVNRESIHLGIGELESREMPHLSYLIRSQPALFH